MTQRPSLSIGIEEEYQIVDPDTRELRSYITEFIEDDKLMMAERELKPELHQSMVELGTPVCRDIAEARDELAKQRTFICDLAESRGVAIVGASTHPFSRWADQPVTPFPRYLGVLEEMQVLAQRLLIFGMHVHIGVEDRAFAIDTMNVVRYMLPHVLALSTSSPFWVGKKTGLKSYRANIFEDFPRSGISDIYPTPADYDGLIDTLVNSGCIPDASKIWWDVRPHHLYPTLEFRVCDVCTRMDEAIAIAALFQAIVLWLWELRQKNVTFRHYRRDLIEEKPLAGGPLRAGRQDDRLRQIGRGADTPVDPRTARSGQRRHRRTGHARIYCAHRVDAHPRDQRRPPATRLRRDGRRPQCSCGSSDCGDKRGVVGRRLKKKDQKTKSNALSSRVCSSLFNLCSSLF
jgi:carboxylate-amine ligase